MGQESSQNIAYDVHVPQSLASASMNEGAGECAVRARAGGRARLCLGCGRISIFLLLGYEPARPTTNHHRLFTEHTLSIHTIV